MALKALPALGLPLALGLALLPQPQDHRPTADARRPVYLGGRLSDEDLTVFTAAAAGRPGAVLLDSAASSKANQQFLAAYRPDRVVPVGPFPEGVADVERRLGVKTAPALEWKRGPPEALWQAWFPRAERVVVCPAEPRRLFLQAACLAGVLEAPLYVTHSEKDEADRLRKQLAGWKAREVHACGAAADLCRDLPDVRVLPLKDEGSVAAAHVEQQRKKGPVRTLVVANPADVRLKLGRMSSLAPWVAVQKQGALLLTNEKGDDASAVVRAALKNDALSQADTLLIVAGLKAVPMERRPNPVPGKDAEIEMEPLTPRDGELFSFATGRLFHDDPAVVALFLARPRLLPEGGAPRKVLLVSNPGGGLPLLETFSRNTTLELRNCGYQAKALFGEDVQKDEVSKLMPEQDVFIWEGHYKTLIEEFGFLDWKEPRPASLLFLQSCLALNEKEAQPLMRRGSLGVVGSSTRIYSATGGAFTLAFFDALLYEDQTLGGALRQAKNFLLVYAQLKQKRLGDGAKLAGANLRSAWAFTLWGDPTVKLPPPEKPAKALTPVRHELKANTLTVYLPEEPYDKVAVGKYEARMVPNSRLAGLLTASPDDEDNRRLVPFVFVEVALPKAPAGKKPQLTSRLPEKNWAFCWDGRRQVGYLLITPRSKDTKEVKFKVEWVD